MPWPIRPSPATPTFLISISLLSLVVGAGAYMGLLEIEDRGGVRHVVMTRSEKRNAMNGEMVLALGEAFRDAAADDSVRIVVIRGEGPMFSSGMDLGSLADLSAQPQSLRPFRAEVLKA